jgi:hypothetical protein
VGGVMLALCSTCEEAEIGWANESMMLKIYKPIKDDRDRNRRLFIKRVNFAMNIQMSMILLNIAIAIH